MKKRLALVIVIVFALQALIPVGAFAANDPVKNGRATQTASSGRATQSLDNGVYELEGSKPEKVGDWLYYAKREYNYSLFKVDSKGKQGAMVMETYSAGSVVVGDRIYFTNDEDGGKLYSVRTDGTDRKQHTDGYFTVSKAVNDVIFGYDNEWANCAYLTKTGLLKKLKTCDYQDEKAVYSVKEQQVGDLSGGILVKSDLDGNMLDESAAFNYESNKYIRDIVGGEVYYNYKNAFYKSDFSGRKAVKLAKFEVRSFLVSGNSVFLTNYDSNLFVVNKSGKGLKKLTKEYTYIVRSNTDKRFVYVQVGKGTLKITSDGKKATMIKGAFVELASPNAVCGMWVTNMEGIGRMKADGTGDEMLYEGRASRVMIKGDRIYFFNDKYILTSIKLDGSDLKVLADGEIQDYKLTDNGVVIYNDGTTLVPYDGSAIVKLNVTGTLYRFKGDYYYVNQNGTALVKASLTGGADEVVAEGAVESVFFGNEAIYYIMDGKTYRTTTGVAGSGKLVGNFSRLESVGDTLVKYSEYNADTASNSYFTVKGDGTGKAVAKSFDDTSYTYFNDWVYYINQADNRYLYKEKLDGTESKLVAADSTITDYSISAEGVFVKFRNGTIKWIPVTGAEVPITDVNASLYNSKVIDGYLHYLIETKAKMGNMVKKLK